MGQKKRLLRLLDCNCSVLIYLTEFFKIDVWVCAYGQYLVILILLEMQQDTV